MKIACLAPGTATPTSTPTSLATSTVTAQPTSSPTLTPTFTPTSTSTPTPSATPIPSYSVGGTVTGLSGTVILQNNGADNILLTSNGVFTFSTPLAPGMPYSITVLTQPATQTCTVSNGSGTMGSSSVTNVTVTCATDTTTLAVSVSSLALSVTGITEYGVSGTPSSGVARIITVTNTGSFNALNLNVANPAYPSGTTSSSTCGSTLAPSSSCTITITPGATASSDGTSPCTSGTVPIPGTVEITADNASTVSTDIVVLGYGCVYQGGYVFAFDDTTPNSGSVSGKVVTTTDQATKIVWSSNGGPGGGSGFINSADTSFDLLPGIGEASTTSVGSPTYSAFTTFFSSNYTNLNPFSSGSFADCNGASDGVCNSANILTFYSQLITNNTIANGDSAPFTASSGPTNATYYAAGLCTQTISGYSDWYLPAVCEMGYEVVSTGSGCGSSSAPITQNIQLGVVDAASLNISGNYWSSTQALYNYSWFQTFDPVSSNSGPDLTNKNALLGVRCVRSIT